MAINDEELKIVRDNYKDKFPNLSPEEIEVKVQHFKMVSLKL